MEFYEWSEKIDSCRLLIMMKSVNEFFFFLLFIRIIIIIYPFHQTIYVCMCHIVLTYHDARVKVSVYIHIYMYIYIYTVEGVCSRLIVDYLRGTCEWMVGCVLLCVIVIKEEKRKEKKNSFVKGLCVHHRHIFKYKSMREWRRVELKLYFTYEFKVSIYSRILQGLLCPFSFSNRIHSR